MSKTKKVVRVALNYVSTVWIDLPMEEVKGQEEDIHEGNRAIIEMAEDRVTDQDIRDADSYLEDTFTSVDIVEDEEI